VGAFPDGILITRNLRTIFVNPAAVGLFGAAHPDQILDRPVLDLFDADHREAVANAIERALGGERVVREHARIVGLDSAAADDLAATALSSPLALVIGAEGKGLRQGTRAACERVFQSSTSLDEVLEILGPSTHSPS
jgi:hypothetical protein